MNEIFPNVDRIEISNTKLEKISDESFSGFDLQILKLSKNKIRKIEKNSFNELKNVEKIFLDRNQIDELDDEIFSSNNLLKILKLENNNLKKISENLFQNLPELKEIFLQDNKIQKVTTEIFKNNQNLEILDLSNNKLKFIEMEILESLKSLKVFDFSGNECTKMTILDEDEKNVGIYEAEKVFEEFCRNDGENGELKNLGGKI